MWILLTVILFILIDDSIRQIGMRITTRKLNKSIEIAVISDFHNTNADSVLKYIYTINPDVILMPGDIVDENYSMKSTEKLFKGLEGWPVYFVSGNHEYKKGRTYSDYKQLQILLDQYHIISIDNDYRIIEINGEKIWIGGIQDHCSDRTKNPDELDTERLEMVCSNLNPEIFSILLMHRPEQYHLIDKYPVDLVVSGHAHGGQWRFPGINGVFAPQQGLFPKRAGGVYPMKHGVHLVSRGLAHYWFLPRVLNHREINVIQIERAD